MVKWFCEWWLDRRAGIELSDYTASMIGLPDMPDRKTAARFRASGLTPREWYQDSRSSQ